MRRIPWVLSIGAVTVAAMPAARAGDTPPNAPTVGIEWELKGPAERRYSASDANWGDHFFVLGGWNKTTSARVDVDSASFERVMCTKKMFGTYPLVSITVDNVGADSSNPTSDQVTAGWRRGTVEIVTGPIAYNDLKRWTQVFTFLSGFFSAVKVACQNNPVGTGTDCVAPIGDVVAAMNQLQTIRADDDLTAINNKTAFACGGPESALREPTSTQRQAGITPESLRDQKIARIRDAAGDAAVITRSTFALTAVHPVTKAPTGILGGVGTQVSFSIGLHQIAAGELSELFAPERGAKGAAQLAYEAALAASSPTLAAWVKTKNLNGLSPAPATTPDEVGFWALLAYAARATSLGLTGAGRKDAHNLLLRTPLLAIYDGLYANQRNKLDDTLAGEFKTAFCSNCVNEVTNFFTSMRAGTDPTSQHKPLSALAGTDVVLEARMGGWTEHANLVAGKSGLGFQDLFKLYTTFVLIAPTYGHTSGKPTALSGKVSFSVEVPKADALAIDALIKAGKTMRARVPVTANGKQQYVLFLVKAMGVTATETTGTLVIEASPPSDTEVAKQLMAVGGMTGVDIWHYTP